MTSRYLWMRSWCSKNAEASHVCHLDITDVSIWPILVLKANRERSWVSEGMGELRAHWEHKWPLASWHQDTHYWTSKNGNLSEGRRRGRDRGRVRGAAGRDTGLLRVWTGWVFNCIDSGLPISRSSRIPAEGRLASQPPSPLRRSDHRVFHTMGNAATAKKGNELESGESALVSLMASNVFYTAFSRLIHSKPPPSS